MGSEGRGITQHLPDIMPTPGILPQGWVYTTLGDIGEINPKLLDECLRRDIDVTFLPMRCLEELTGNLDLSLTRKLSDVKKGYTPFKNGDVIFAKITPCMENGKVAVVHGLRNGIGFGSTEFHVIRLPESFPREFMFYSLVREELRRDARANMTGSAGQLRVPVNYLRQMPIALPPLLEQHRIVAKIEELSTRLDAGVHALRAIKAQLKRYRQAVLKHAFEGKLTADWRKAHRDELEPASVLLERIKQEHQRTPRGEHKKPPALDISTLTQLPNGWEWTRLDTCVDILDSRRVPVNAADRNKRPGNIPYYGATGQVGWIDDYLFDEELVLLGEDGAPFLEPSKNKAYIIRGKSWVNNHAHVLRALAGLTSNTFICHYLNIFSYAGFVSGTTRFKLNQFPMRTIPVPLPSGPEQQRIVDEIERRFSVVEQIEKTVDQGLKQAERLRQSILKKAFEGKLVPQDPNDEPAEILLGRIREERTRHKAGVKPQRALRKKVTTQETRLM